MSIPEITSPTNPRVKDLVRLRKRSHRDEAGLFLIEGRAEVERAIDAGVDVVEAFLAPGVSAGAFAVPHLTRLSSGAFAKVAYRGADAAVVAVARQFSTALGDLHVPQSPLLLAVERVEKPGNLGALLRTADAAGVDAVVVADPGTDVFNPNVVRASLGTLFATPVAVADTSAALTWLSAQEIRVVATSPAADVTLYDADLTGSLAIAVGAESTGLTSTWLQGEAVRIPMAGSADSLNTSVSAAVALFEAVRQRSRPSTL